MIKLIYVLVSILVYNIGLFISTKLLKCKYDYSMGYIFGAIFVLIMLCS
ncbi:MAG: hypothetical protein ACI3T9_02140 [Romboutsia timonensis]